MDATAWRKRFLCVAVLLWIATSERPLAAQEHWLGLHAEKVGQAELYRRMREFYLIDAIGILLPKGPDQVGIEYLEYSDEELDDLQEMTTALLDRLETNYRTVRPKAQAYFSDRELPNTLAVGAVITNIARSGRWAQISSDGRIRIDAELFNRNLRATLSDTIPELVATSYEQAKAEDSELLEYFSTPESFVVPTALKLRRTIELTRAPGFLASRFTIWGFVSTPSVSTAYEALLSLERRYVGTLLFVLAHELGHYALGTTELPVTATTSQRQQAELDADRFASMLLANTYMAMSIQVIDLSNYGVGLFEPRRIEYSVSVERLKRYTGDGIYFTRSYHSPIGYNETDYPAVEERLAAAEDARNVMYEGGIEAVSRNVRNRVWLSSFVHNLRYLLGIP